MSIRLYVGNLPKELERQELADVFAEEGESVSTKVITDRKTGKCRGFGFVTVQTDEQADQIIEKYSGRMFKDIPIKIEKALPRTKGKGPDDGQGNEETSDDTPVVSNNPPPTVRRKSSNNKSSSRRSTTTSTPEVSESVQPDPRWAQELEKLKELLAAQTASS